MENVKAFMSGVLTVAIIITLILAHKINNKLDNLTETLNKQTAVERTEKHSRHDTHPDEMFNKFFDLVVKLKELESNNVKNNKVSE
jgi:hypothetical protein